MTALNEKREAMDLEVVRPYEVFDLIGGTSTAGQKPPEHINDGSTLTSRKLIAILLGRLKMDVDECITDYTKILRTVFNKDKRGCHINWKDNVKRRFDSNVLAKAFEDILMRKGLFSGAMLYDRGIRGNGDCKVYVNIVLFGKNWTNTPSRLFVQPHTRRRTLCVSGATSFQESLTIFLQRY